MLPLVALTTTTVPKGGGHKKPQVAIYSNYLEAFERLGLACVLVTPAHSTDSIEQLVRGCAGLVLTGGEDIEPSRYGEEPIPELGSVNPLRDEAEFAAVACATDAGLPVFGICRGCQLLNVHFGGTLYQDLATQCPQSVSHQQPGGWAEHHHQVRVEPDSRLGELLGAGPLRINSFHHQAIKDVAPNFRVTGRAEDGLIEAVECTRHPWIVGVQWHPERHEAHAPDTDPNRRVMMAFRAAVIDYHEASR